LSKLIYSLILILAVTLSSLSASLPEVNQLVERETSFYRQRFYNYENKGHFFIRHIDYHNSPVYQTSFYIPGNKGVINYVNLNKEIVSIPLTNGLTTVATTLFISTDDYHMVLGQPYSYRSLGNGTIEAVQRGQISFKKEDMRWLVSYSFRLQPNQFGVMWGLGSKNTLVDWDYKSMRKIWANYDLDQWARLNYNGYHYKSPSSYVPSSPSSFWHIPSDFLTNALIKTGGSLASEILGNALLMINALNINDEGYYATQPLSNWLYTDYQIKGNFFDTRFNADTIETYIRAYRKYQLVYYREHYLKMAQYYLAHGEKHHYKVYNQQGVEGWLVQDYFGEGGKKNHVSLNHQVQGAHIFYMLYSEERDERYLKFADKLLQGVKNTRDQWLMSDGNLHYAYLIDGTMGLKDYPHLTYNDLFTLQKDLVNIYGSEDPDIKLLMTSKRVWMDANGVTDYMK